MSVRVSDERLDELAAMRTENLMGWPWRFAVADLAAFVADLRACRADNQRLREALEEAHRTKEPSECAREAEV